MSVGIGVVEERCVLVCRHAAYSAKPAHTKVPFWKLTIKYTGIREVSGEQVEATGIHARTQ